MDRIQFGSDGWRGTIAGEYTFDNVRRAAEGTARYFKSIGVANRGIVIGYDQRFASECFASAAAEVLAANDIHVFLVNAAVPTPVISLSILSRQAAGAIIITASHNPPMDNGFKVRDGDAASITPEKIRQIENRIPSSVADVKHVPLKTAIGQGLVEVFDPSPAYVEHIKSHVDLERIKQSRLVVAYDAMWGVGTGWFDRLLGSGSLRLHGIHEDRNPIFPGMIRPEPIPPNIDALSKTVLDIGADVGIATDGDADRMGLVDEKGDFVTQLQVAGLLAVYLLEIRNQRGAIVKTLDSTVMLNILGKKFGVDVYNTATTPMHVAAKIIETNAMLGATESGGFLFRGLPERDGVLANICLLDLMVRTGKKPSQLLDWLYELVGTRYYYSRIDTGYPSEQRDVIWQRISDAKPTTIAGLAVTGIDSTDGIKFNLADGGWLLIRFSGTEPIMRFYVETTQDNRQQDILVSGLKLAGLK